jgi:heat shock protein HtpX
MVVNLLILVTISIFTSVFGIGHYITAAGLNLKALAIFCLMYGMIASTISLLLSRFMAKMMMGVRVIDPNTHEPASRDLVARVHRLARGAGISTMPQVGIYDSPEVNAFATGPTKNRALVAVSTGLLQKMSAEEVDGVLGHEVAHIQNGDMVTMTLIQGVVNAFVMFFARVIAFFASNFVREELRYIVNFAITIVLEIFLSFLGMMVVAYFSRLREFRADRGGATLAGRANMINALQALQRSVAIQDPNHAPASLATMKISGSRGGLMALFSTHPPLEERIARLSNTRI